MAFQRQTNEWRFWKCPFCTKKLHSYRPISKNMIKNVQLNRTKILNTSKTFGKCSLFPEPTARSAVQGY